MTTEILGLIQASKEDSQELDSVISYRPGEGASEEAMYALRQALLRVNNDPSKLDQETLAELVRIARQTNSSTRGMVLDMAV